MCSKHGWYLQGVMNLYNCHTKSMWMAPRPATSLSSSQAVLNHGFSGLWESEQLPIGKWILGKQFPRRPSTNKAPRKCSFLKGESFTWIYGFTPWRLWWISLDNSWDVLKAAFLLSQCKVLDFFVMVLISLPTIISLSTTFNMLFFWQTACF
jgi:hypothetical protein